MKKIRKNIINVKAKIFPLLLSIIFIASCSKYLDVNTDPDSITDNPGIYLLPSIEISIGSIIGGQLALHGSLWAQYYNQNNTANQYRTIIDMQLQADDGDVTWDELYPNALSDIKKLKEYSDLPQNYNPRLKLIATVLEAYAFQVIFDCYGQAPYTEAIKGESDGNFTPVFDNGSDVYPLLIKSIDNAIAELNTFYAENPDAPLNLRADFADQDYLLAGDMNAWIAFANNVKLKIAMRNLDFDPNGSKAIISDLEARNNYLNQDVMLDIFREEVLKENPLYATDQNIGTTINLVANRTLSEFLTTNGDPREPLIFQPNSAGNLLLDHGDHRATTTTHPEYSNRTLIWDATRPVYFITTSEINFFRAELVVKGIISGNAKDYYDAAVDQAFTRLGASSAGFLGAGESYEFRSNGTQDEMLEDIGVQKWAAMANVNPYEGFLEMNRLDYPEILQTMTYVSQQPTGNKGAKLYLPKNTVLGNNYIKRYLLPESERTSNSNNFPTQTIVNDRLWWDTH
jgi:hypothetical protein